MTIDWFTLAAQVANFLILLLLLRRFLYQPVIGVMRRREEEIERRFQEAEESRREAKEEAERLREERRELEEKRKALIEEAREEAEKRRSEMMEEARREVEQQRERWQEGLQRDRAKARRTLRLGAARQALAAARKSLENLASEDLQARAVDSFLNHLTGLGEDDRRVLADAVDAEEPELVVRSAFELEPDERRRIVGALQEATDRDELEAEFEVDEALLLGLEVEAEGRLLRWSADHYFDELESEVEDLLGSVEPADIEPHEADA